MDPHDSDATRAIDDDDHEWVYEGEEGWDEAEWHEDDEVERRVRRRRPKRPRRTAGQRLLLVAGVLAVMGAVTAALALGNVWRKQNAIERVVIEELDVAEESGPLNFLIVGSDSREAIDASDPNAALFIGDGDSGGGQRADTMVVLRFDEEAEKLDILSIPRDLWVPIADTGSKERINTAYGGEDGPNQLIKTIQNYLGIPINHYAEIDFLGFQGLVDAVDGVPMYFDTIYQDTNSGLVVREPGCVNLTGQQALAFVRARKLQYMNASGYWESDPTGDLGRISRQQIFLRNALEKARDRTSLFNYGEYNELLDVAVNYLRLDEDLEPTILAAMGQRYAEFEGESLETHTLPVTEFTTGGGAAVLQLNEAEAQPVLNVFRGLPPDAIEPSWVSITVLNGSGVPGQAGLVQEAFEADGFVVTSVGDVPRPEGEDLTETRVVFAPGSDALADFVERFVTGGAELIEDPQLSAGEIIVETGTDFTTVEQVPRDDASTPADPGDGDATTTSAPGSEQTTTTVDAAATTTPTTVIGRTPGQPPEGVDCGAGS